MSLGQQTLTVIPTRGPKLARDRAPKGDGLIGRFSCHSQLPTGNVARNLTVARSSSPPFNALGRAAAATAKTLGTDVDHHGRSAARWGYAADYRPQVELRNAPNP